MKNNGRVTCPVCGADLGPVQPLIGTLTGCRKCRVWVNSEGEIVKDPHKHFQKWQRRKKQHKKYVNTL